jgi:hypothetical protein
VARSIIENFVLEEAMMPATTKTLSAQNTFTDPVFIIGDFNLSISGTFSGTVTVQRSTDGTTWRDVDTWTIPVEEVGYDPMKNFYRAGFKTGQYTSGSATILLNGYDTWPPRF